MSWIERGLKELPFDYIGLPAGYLMAGLLSAALIFAGFSILAVSLSLLPHYRAPRGVMAEDPVLLFVRVRSPPSHSRSYWSSSSCCLTRIG